MLELHGWITVREPYEYDDDDDDFLDDIVKNVELMIQGFNWGSGILQLNYFNGIPTITIAIQSNRKTSEVSDVFELCEYLKINASGSYGLIYMHDDEDLEGNQNNFIAYILARGELRQEIDTYLSPCIPRIEK
ncbi:hypothetical protein HCB27_14260 [Listeria booriae]|uniref:Immunity protein 7 n=1 Tax=Listeria booriae TaxID=1552123 RepID=A0A7X0Z890_9LIST|nr:Imm7 family immunity protein [Listeria booriae]MBC2177787.1 hypothetical protein [Listeria booriae]MBC2177792.1 hypothetical protein [Listeria booriae]